MGCPSGGNTRAAEPSTSANSTMPRGIKVWRQARDRASSGTQLCCPQGRKPGHKQKQHQSQWKCRRNPKTAKAAGNDVTAAMPQLQFSAGPGRLEPGLHCAVRHDERENRHPGDAPPPLARRPRHRQSPHDHAPQAETRPWQPPGGPDWPAARDRDGADD